MINVLRWSSWNSWAEQREFSPKNTNSFEPQVAEQVRPGDRPIPNLPNSFFGIKRSSHGEFYTGFFFRLLCTLSQLVVRAMPRAYPDPNDPKYRIDWVAHSRRSLSASAETWHICTMVECMSRDDSVTVMKSHLGYSCTSSTAQGGGGSFKDRKQ